MFDCLSGQYLSVGWEVSRRLTLIPTSVHQTPVPRSSDRRSYYFLIARVARVPRERLHHVTDSSVNTGSPRVTEWELTAVTPLSRLFFSPHTPQTFHLNVPPPWPGPLSRPPRVTFTWRPGSSHMCWSGVISNLATGWAENNKTPNSDTFTVHYTHSNSLFLLRMIFSIFLDAPYYFL